MKRNGNNDQEGFADQEDIDSENEADEEDF